MPETIAFYYQYLIDRPIIPAGGLLILLAAVLLLRRRQGAWLTHLQRKPLLTANETEFLYRLRRALPTHHIFPQVSFAALITDDGKLSTNARWSVRAKFDRKIADFVVCDRNLNVLALVELDDRTHVAAADRQRDAITRAAGYQTLRFQSKQSIRQSKPRLAASAGVRSDSLRMDLFASPGRTCTR